MITRTFNVLGRSHVITSVDEEQLLLEAAARVLAGYDEATWKKLKNSRKATYRRSAATLLYNSTDLSPIIQQFRAYQTDNIKERLKEKLDK
jgi:hypothetical protein